MAEILQHSIHRSTNTLSVMESRSDINIYRFFMAEMIISEQSLSSTFPHAWWSLFVDLAGRCLMEHTSSSSAFSRRSSLHFTQSIRAESFCDLLSCETDSYFLNVDRSRSFLYAVNHPSDYSITDGENQHPIIGRLGRRMQWRWTDCHLVSAGLWFLPTCCS